MHKINNRQIRPAIRLLAKSATQHKTSNYNYYYYICLTAFFSGQPG